MKAREKYRRRYRTDALPETEGRTNRGCTPPPRLPHYAAGEGREVRRAFRKKWTVKKCRNVA